MKSSRFPRLFVLALGVAAAVSSCNGRREQTPSPEAPPVRVRVLRVERTPHPASEEVVGTVRAKVSARVESKISGRISQFLGAPGQAVKRGQVLIVIDAAEIQARLDQAAALLAQAQKDHQRLQPLVASNAVSRQEFDAAEARLRVATSGVAEAETMMGYARITAPFDGVITRKVAEVGDLAMPGKTLLEMESPADLRFEVDVPEALLDHIRSGAVLPVRLNAVAAPLSGTVVEVAPVADPGSRTFLVKLDLPRTPGVRTGQFGRVRVPVGMTDTPWVPAEAVSTAGQMELVSVVSDGRARSRIVRTGKRADGRVEIIAGLDPGEQVIVGGVVEEGRRVEVGP